jgi:hypothetical protein
MGPGTKINKYGSTNIVEVLISKQLFTFTKDILCACVSKRKREIKMFSKYIMHTNYLYIFTKRERYLHNKLCR